MTKRRGGGVPGRKNPAELRLVFGQNLRVLIQHEPSVSALCRSLGINRTQFNRYLSGESFPRPDVLAVICDYFDVDARILLEPIDIVNQKPRLVELETEKRLISEIREAGILTVDPRSFSDGFYLIYLRPDNRSDTVIVLLLLVARSADGLALSHYYLPANIAELLGVPSHKRRLASIITQHRSGVAFFSLIPDAGLMTAIFVNVGFLATQRYYRGRVTSSEQIGPGANLAMTCVFEKLGKSPKDAFAARNRIGYKPFNELPRTVQSFFVNDREDLDQFEDPLIVNSRRG